MAVATLSAERIGRSLGDVLPYARRVHIRSLYVGSAKDGYTTFGADTRALYRATPAERKPIVLVGGAAHGVDLLSGVHGARIGGLLSGFIRKATAERAARLGSRRPLPAADLATMLIAPTNQMAMERLADPSAVPEELCASAQSSCPLIAER